MILGSVLGISLEWSAYPPNRQSDFRRCRNLQTGMQHCFRCDVGLKGDMLKPHVLMFAIVLMLGAPLFSQAGDSLSLPPDPGEAGKATLEGIDSDGDGVRDDVQRWIAMAYPNSQKVRAALTQAALTMQTFLMSANSPVAAYNSAIKMGKDYECFAYISPNSYKINSELKAIFLNTYLRSQSWVQADQTLSGKTFYSTPFNQWKQNCNFNPDVMLN